MNGFIVMTVNVHGVVLCAVNMSTERIRKYTAENIISAPTAVREWTVTRMDDLISRREATNELWSLNDQCDSIYYTKCIHDAVYALEILPSAQRWIPCSERLPDKNEWYLISNGLDSWVAIWSKENKEWLSVTGLDYTITDVIAWMEFPEPPKEDKL